MTNKSILIRVSYADDDQPIHPEILFDDFCNECSLGYDIELVNEPDWRSMDSAPKALGDRYYVLCEAVIVQGEFFTDRIRTTLAWKPEEPPQ